MDPNELLKLLNLNAKPDPSAEGPSAITSSESAPNNSVNSSTNATALEVDEWGLRRGRDRLLGGRRGSYSQGRDQIECSAQVVHHLFDLSGSRPFHWRAPPMAGLLKRRQFPIIRGLYRPHSTGLPK